MSDCFAVTDLHGGVYRKEKSGYVCAGLAQMGGAYSPGFFCDDPGLQRFFTMSANEGLVKQSAEYEYDANYIKKILYLVHTKLKALNRG